MAFWIAILFLLTGSFCFYYYAKKNADIYSALSGELIKTEAKIVKEHIFIGSANSINLSVEYTGNDEKVIHSKCEVLLQSGINCNIGQILEIEYSPQNTKWVKTSNMSIKKFLLLSHISYGFMAFCILIIFIIIYFATQGLLN